MQIAGSSAIVVGGAGGLGEATVRRLHDAGAKVVDHILDYNQGDSGTFNAAEGDAVDRGDFIDATMRSIEIKAPVKALADSHSQKH